MFYSIHLQVTLFKDLWSERVFSAIHSTLSRLWCDDKHTCVFVCLLVSVDWVWFASGYFGEYFKKYRFILFPVTPTHTHTSSSSQSNIEHENEHGIFFSNGSVSVRNNLVLRLAGCPVRGFVRLFRIFRKVSALNPKCLHDTENLFARVVVFYVNAAISVSLQDISPGNHLPQVRFKIELDTPPPPPR